MSYNEPVMGVHTARVDRSHLSMYLLVAAAAFVIFLPWIQVYFLGDDWMLLARNSGRVLPSQLISISDTSNSRWYRPLSESTLAWAWALFGLNPIGHHVVSFTLHALNAVLVAALGQRLARDRRVGLVAGLSFAVLGCHTEAVVWVTARHEMLASALALLSLIAYIKFRESGQRMWWIAAVLFYIASFGFKETPLALPLLFLLYDLIFVFRSRGVRQWRLIARHALPVLLPASVGIAYALFRVQVGGGYDVPFSAAALPKNLVYYLLMESVALPVSTQFLSRFPLETLPAVVSLTIACALSAWLARDRLMRHRLVWFGAVWMVFALAPVILIVAERTTYFSSAGWAWAIATTVILAWDGAAHNRFASKRRLVVLAVVTLLGANLITLIHRSYWWNRAADISRGVTSQVRVSLLALPPGEDNQLWFFNFPDQIEYAYAFGDRIPFTVWLLQHQLGVGDVEALVFRGSEVDVPSPERVRQMLTERAAQGPVVAFYWQGDTVTTMSTLESVLRP